MADKRRSIKFSTSNTTESSSYFGVDLIGCLLFIGAQLFKNWIPGLHTGGSDDWLEGTTLRVACTPSHWQSSIKISPKLWTQWLQCEKDIVYCFVDNIMYKRLILTGNGKSVGGFKDISQQGAVSDFWQLSFVTELPRERSYAWNGNLYGWAWMRCKTICYILLVCRDSKKKYILYIFSDGIPNFQTVAIDLVGPLHSRKEATSKSWRV